ncbi:MAG TPA: type VI secretion system contractile sheath small subunit [Verrucomicrobiae bacterium]|nr:type VI secretion system contractile sheath small subunit [Verrucomicrobiae bacterium]
MPAQDHIARNRPPRVHIKYGVETHGAFVKGELPFIIGVMAGLSGKPETPLPPVAEREFKNVTGENFDKFMEAQNVRASFRVKDTLSGKPDGEITVDLPFRSVKDFDPGQVVEMVPALAELMRERESLDELWDKLQTKDKAIEALQNILKDPALMEAVLKELDKEASPEA